MKRILFLLSIVCFILYNVAVADEQDTLVIAVAQSYTPFSLLNVQGAPAGMWVDIWKLWSEKTGKTIKIQPYVWKDSLSALREGKADVHFGLFRNKEREVWMDFSQPFYGIGTGLFYSVAFDEPPRLEDLSGKKVGAVSGSYQESWLQENYPKIKIVSLANQELLIYAAKDKRIDAFLGEAPSVDHLLNKLGMLGDIARSGETLFSNQVFAGVAKGREDLLQLINKGFSQISQKEWHRMESLWIPDPSRRYYHDKQIDLPFTQAERLWLQEHQVIRVGGPKAFPPFHYFEGDTLNGISWDYLQFIMSQLGVQIVVQKNLPWPEVLKRAKSRELDLISLAAKTKERETFLHYTDPYLSFPLVIIAQKNTPLMSGLDDLNGKKVAVIKKGSIYEWLMRDEIKIIPHFVGTPSEALEAVSFGQADANISNLALASYLIPQKGLANLKIAAPTSYGNYDLFMAVRKDWPELVSILNKALFLFPKKQKQKLFAHWMPLGVTQFQNTLKFTLEEQAWIKTHPVVRVANEDDWPPFDFSVNGKAQGISIDYIKLIGEKTGLQFEFINGFSWNALQEKARNKELEILTSIVKTPEREKSFLFTTPYLESPTIIVTAQDDNSVSRLKDLSGRTVASIQGYYQDEYLKNRYPNIQRLSVASPLEGLKAVAYNKANAYVGSLAVVNYEINRAFLPNLKVAGDTGDEKIDGLNLRFAVHKDSGVLRDILQKGVNAITQAEKNQIQIQWNSRPKEPEKQQTEPDFNLTKAERAWLKAHRSIRVGVDPAYPPFDYLDQDGIHKGIASDYIQLINERLGVDMKAFPGRNWSEVMAGVKTNETDVISSITKTEEREKFLNFTDPYIAYPIVILTRQNYPLVSGLKDFSGKTIVLVKDYYHNPQALREVPSANTFKVDTPLEALSAVSKGLADTYIGNLAVIGYLIRKHNLVNLTIAAPTSIENPGLSFGVRKDWPELITILNKVLSSIEEEQQLLISRKWVSLSDKRQVDYTLIWQIVGVMGMVIFVGLVWNFQIRRQKEALRESEQKFRSLVEGFKESYIFYAHDTERKFTYISPSVFDVLGYTPEEFVQQSKKLLDSSRNKEGLRYTQLTLQGKRQPSFEVETQHRDGSIRILGISEVPVTDESKKIIGVEGIAHDITDRKKSEEELKAAKEAAEVANRAKSEFLANMSHELRTPLNGILGYAQILEKEKNLSEQQRNGIEVIHRSGEYLLNLINDVLDFSKIEAGKMESHITDFNLLNMLDEITDVFLVRARNKGISFHYDQLSELPAYVAGDEKKIRQVVINLLSNAIKFTEKGGVVLKVGYHNEQIRFQVEDTGIGITEAALETIFESFQQVEQESLVIEGTGLGLAISHQLTKLMGSELQVQSKLNQGSTFWFDLKLPEAESSPNVENQDKNTEVLGFRGDSPTILVVDDKEDNRAVLGGMLTPLGFNILEAVNGLDCVNQTMKHKPKLILLDIRMPEMDGFEAMSRIREMSFGQDIIVIIISASAFNHNRQESLDAGADDFIAKPFRLNQLLNILQQHLQLEWIYSEETTKESQSKSKNFKPDRTSNTVTLPRELLEKLNDLSMRGNIRGIQQTLHQLEEDGQFPEFVAEMRQLTKMFQIEKVQSLIQDLLEQ
ncbi:MAG: transporter substrate-binding domain-containing protein [SAR324 cluster bacterium]|nr:transporter substrate-binding domain-containing protein [SAR324 cluster bacterium]